MKIDIFAHILTPRYAARVIDVLRMRGDRSAKDYETMIRLDSTLVDLDERFRAMDKLGNDYRQVLVMGHTSVEHESPSIAANLARIGNEELSQLAVDHPDRFAGWVAQTALQDGSAGLAAVKEAVAEGALGAQVFTAMQGRCIDHPDYEPFFALMAELDRPIWIHPNRTVQWSDFPLAEPESRFGMYSFAGWPTDTAVTMCRLVYSGHLDRWPNLKLITHHGGGTIPVLAGRIRRRDEANEHPVRLQRPLLEYLKRFYADTATFGNPIVLRAALEFFGADHLLFGTDFGFSQNFAPYAIDDMEAVVVDEATKRAIYEGNARRLLRLE